MTNLYEYMVKYENSYGETRTKRYQAKDKSEVISLWKNSPLSKRNTFVSCKFLGLIEDEK